MLRTPDFVVADLLGSWRVYSWKTSLSYVRLRHVVDPDYVENDDR
jgi:hypothetical protein